MKNDFIIKNQAEVLNLLHQLPKGYDAKFLRKVLGTSVNPTVKAAQAKAPVDMGILAKSMGKIQMRRAKFVSLVVGPRVKGAFKGSRDKKLNKGGWYGYFVEFGTSKQKAQPFMRPAYEGTKKAVETRFFKFMATKFEKEVKRLAKKGINI